MKILPYGCVTHSGRWAFDHVLGRMEAAKDLFGFYVSTEMVTSIGYGNKTDLGVVI